MEIQPLLTDQFPEIDVHCSAEAIPTRKSLRLHALDVPERVADVLKIEAYAALQQAGSLAVPAPEKMSVRALARLMAVRAAERFFLTRLGVSAGRKNAQRDPRYKGEFANELWNGSRWQHDTLKKRMAHLASAASHFVLPCLPQESISRSMSAIKSSTVTSIPSALK
jgi:hypothetical protein